MGFVDDGIGLAPYTDCGLALVALRMRIFMWWQLMNMCRSERNDTWNKEYIWYVAGVYIEAGEAYSGPHLIPDDNDGRAGYSTGGL